MKNNSIVLIGMSGAGKSTVGNKLHRILGYAFTDLDQYMLRKENAETIPEIIKVKGERYFKELEEQSMREINLNNMVVASGGSIILYTKLMNDLEHRTTLIYLKCPFETIEERLSESPPRGIVDSEGRTLRQVYNARGPLYSLYADIIINCQGKQKEQIVNETAQRYLKFNNK